MSESEGASWLVIDGYEDEPAAFGVPPYVGFHIRYICGCLLYTSPSPRDRG